PERRERVGDPVDGPERSGEVVVYGPTRRRPRPLGSGTRSDGRGPLCEDDDDQGHGPRSNRPNDPRPRQLAPCLRPIGASPRVPARGARASPLASSLREVSVKPDRGWIGGWSDSIEAATDARSA